MAIAGVMLNRKLISKQELLNLEKQMLKKYGIPENSIYRDYRIVKLQHTSAGKRDCFFSAAFSSVLVILNRAGICRAIFDQPYVWRIDRHPSVLKDKRRNPDISDFFHAVKHRVCIPKSHEHATRTKESAEPTPGTEMVSMK